MIWKRALDLETLNAGNTKLTAEIGLEFIAFDEQSVTARFPVNEKTCQPYGVLHGGVSCLVAETMGSVAGNLAVIFTNVDLSLYHRETGTVYVADNFVSSKGKIFRPYPMYSPSDYKRSLQRYVDLKCKTYLLAHYGAHEVSKEQILSLKEKTPGTPRVHTNTLAGILAKLIRSLFRK